MMRRTALPCFIIVIAVLCISHLSCTSGKTTADQAPAQPDSSNYPGLISLTEPDKNYRKAPIYLDSAEINTIGGQRALLIHGQLPTGCAKLHKAGYQIENNSTIVLQLQAWQPEGVICTQALVPFSYMYSDLDQQILNKLKYYRFNGKRHTF